jgi:AcrR family transcriptional regulator
VAREAGFTRGALYHLFANKEELALAVVAWVSETWDAEVRQPALREDDPLASLMLMAKGHGLYCRRHQGAQVMLTLRVEFTGQDHPVGRAMAETYDQLESDCARLVGAARRRGSIPPGPPARLTAAALLAVLESVAIELAGKPPHDLELLARGVRGVLGVAPLTTSSAKATDR